MIHIPKTIDNDYFGIAWTFGYWSSVQASQEALLNLKADAESTSSYFIVELMGRKAGWLTYAAGIAGEAVQMISTEDIEEDVLDIEKLAEQIVDTILLREKNDKYYGVICVAEGLADKLPEKYRPTEKDRHGNVILGTAEVGRVLRDAAEEATRSAPAARKRSSTSRSATRPAMRCPSASTWSWPACSASAPTSCTRTGNSTAWSRSRTISPIVGVPFERADRSRRPC